MKQEKWPALVAAGMTVEQAQNTAKRKAWLRSELDIHLANAAQFARETDALKVSAAPLFSEDGVDYSAVAAELARIHAVVTREGR
jgi:hypothetical protein